MPEKELYHNIDLNNENTKGIHTRWKKGIGLKPNELLLLISIIFINILVIKHQFFESILLCSYTNNEIVMNHNHVSHYRVKNQTSIYIHSCCQLSSILLQRRIDQLQTRKSSILLLVTLSFYESLLQYSMIFAV